MIKDVLRIEGAFGRGVFNLLGNVLVERFPHMLDLVPAEDKPINEFMDVIKEQGKRFSMLDALRVQFAKGASLEYHRAQKGNWVFGFADYRQLRSMFFEDESIAIVQKAGLHLNRYRVPEEDICFGKGQVLFFKPSAIKVERLSLETGQTMPSQPEGFFVRTFRRRYAHREPGAPTPRF